MFDTSGPIPLHSQVADFFKEKMASGAYAEGSRLAPETELCKQLGVSRSTLRLAFDKLEAEGLITRGRGKGTFVARMHDARRVASTGDARISSQGAASVVPGGKDMWAAVVVPTLDSTIISKLVGGIGAEASKSGLALRFYQTGYDPGPMDAVISRAVQDGASGLLAYVTEETVYSEAIAQLVDKGFPVCLFDRAMGDLVADCSMTDNIKGGYLATSHLISLGHERIAFVSPATEATYTAWSRYRGYRRAMAQAGLAVNESHVIIGKDRQSLTKERLEAVFTGEGRPTAAFVLYDALAIEVIGAARRMGLRVPDDLAVVGFDNLDTGAKFDVPLTTVDQPFERIGRTATVLLLGRLSGASSGCQTWIYHEPRLVVRSSCGAEPRA